MRGYQSKRRFVCGILTSCFVLGLLNFSVLPPTLPSDQSTWIVASLPFLNETDTSKKNGTVQSEIVRSDGSPVSAARKFFILNATEMSTWLIGNNTPHAIRYYKNCLNERSIEIWLHRGFEKLSGARTFDEKAATAFLIPYYGHFASTDPAKPDPEEFAKILLQTRIHDKTKPHILLCPSLGNGEAGIGRLIGILQASGVNVWSVGIERNPSWQSIAAERIIPIPYLVKPAGSVVELKELALRERKNSSVFYAGDERGNAVKWSGCNRSMVRPLMTAPNMVIKLTRDAEIRLSQPQYNQFMKTTEFCLILCGDTPTSRSLASAVIHGCIPLRIGSRLRGLCEKPCKRGFGWRITGPKAPHLPYLNVIPWSEFPEVNEAAFVKAPEATLREVMESYSAEKKQRLRDILVRVQLGWIYGWGSPVTSTDFGEAAAYIWNSTLFLLDTIQNTTQDTR